MKQELIMKSLPQAFDFVKQIGLSEDWESDYRVGGRRALQEEWEGDVHDLMRFPILPVYIGYPRQVFLHAPLPY